jgi:hypothetical protein
MILQGQIVTGVPLDYNPTISPFGVADPFTVDLNTQNWNELFPSNGTLTGLTVTAYDANANQIGQATFDSSQVDFAGDSLTAVSPADLGLSDWSSLVGVCTGIAIGESGSLQGSPYPFAFVLFMVSLVAVSGPTQVQCKASQILVSAN